MSYFSVMDIAAIDGSTPSIRVKSAPPAGDTVLNFSLTLRSLPFSCRRSTNLGRILRQTRLRVHNVLGKNKIFNFAMV